MRRHGLLATGPSPAVASGRSTNFGNCSACRSRVIDEALRWLDEVTDTIHIDGSPELVLAVTEEIERWREWTLR